VDVYLLLFFALRLLFAAGLTYVSAEGLGKA
jgi:hypothetical protein